MTVQAVAVLIGEGISGAITFKQNGIDEPTHLFGEISGLKRGLHGFHIHEFGDSRQGCISAGPHYNPMGKTHGGREDSERHSGDLGNIEADSNGIAKIDFSDKFVKLEGPYSAIGRALVVHADSDDLGKGIGDKQNESMKTGNAGARLACGVIALAKVE